VVGVRVRPFNQREQDLNAVLCLDMQGPTTHINDKTGNVTSFSFDQSFWSHDGFEDDGTGYMKPVPGSKRPYADQRYVYDTFGQRVLDNAWAGYHCCLFAYGQTGSGKSYSMVGYGQNKGIVPISCEEIFKRIGTNTDADKHYEVMVSMLEIYNETVQDLFVGVDDRPKHGLQIRESKALGIYIDGIIKNAVSSYEEIEKAIEHGTSNRSIASTAMNATSSRAHTVITIEFKQVQKIQGGQQAVKVSNINLVDLAGSEKANQTGAKGDRLKEGSAINKSLSALGNVIEKLAERSQGKKNVVIPYRDSKLTRLLQNALGGSSKTIMVCALSPASSNYEETLSTLRYADRAKKIKNHVVINENPQEKLMREMKEENERLMEMLKKMGGGVEGGAPGGASSELVREQEDKIAQLEQMLKEQQMSFQDKLNETREREDAHGKNPLDANTKNIGGSQTPLMVNLNAERSLSGRLRYVFTDDAEVTIGGHGPPVTKKKEGSDSDSDSDSDSGDEPDILLGADGVFATHAKVENKERRCFLTAVADESASSTWVNGKCVQDLLSAPWARDGDGWTLKEGPGLEGPWREEGSGYEEGDPAGVLLLHGDRLVFGKGFFLFVDPRLAIPEMMVMAGKYTYSRARRELPEHWREGVKTKGLKNVLHAAFAKSKTKKMEDEKDDSDSESQHTDSEDEKNKLESQLHRTGDEVSLLRKKLQETEALLKKARQQEQAEKEAKESALLAVNNAKQAAFKADKEKKAAQAQARDALEAAAVFEELRPSTDAKMRLDLAITRILSAMEVARAAGVDATGVVAAEAKLDMLRKNVQVSEKLSQACRITDDSATMQVKLALAQVKQVHGMPIDKRMVQKTEARLQELIRVA